jgi:hypothetical protein
MDTHPSLPRTELDLITEQELARHLKICRRQLYNWRVGGLIPYFKLGKAVRFRVADVVVAALNQRAALESSGSLAQNVNYAIKSSYLLSFLESTPDVVTEMLDEKAQDQPFEDVVEQVKKATVLVLIY